MTSTSIQLFVENPTCHVGETVRGTVTLDIPTLQAENVNEVVLRMTGLLTIGYTVGVNPRVPRIGRIFYVNKTQEVWKRETEDDSACSGVFTMDFNWRMSDRAPQSVETSEKNPVCYVSMVYRIEAVGVRHGLLRRNKRIRRTITVLPPNPIGQMEPDALERLRRGWEGPWRQMGVSKHIRRFWLLGDNAYVEILLACPERVLPIAINTDIPFKLIVITKSQPGPYKPEEESWPHRPAKQSDIHFARHQIVDITVQNSQIRGTIKQRGGTLAKLKIGDVDWERQAKKWEAYEGGEGRWISTTVLKSSFRQESPDAHISLQHTGGRADIDVQVRGHDWQLRWTQVSLFVPAQPTRQSPPRCDALAACKRAFGVNIFV
ncbi:uncharacterized protein B0H18DRAFT_391692 [Fomitopsis serialis]|uniref:uncharacterized protein n=1 Tax=Fomitopsis serialis TaxID=139415 RepID=UPI0020073911|nr:uncharacterized protein B0H18DRAFT_391692 [Neoantrodia serialis]KAH9911039.1 hypothetical protein B0H18DRAFT_391692 [Neoantrodia serialis]